jgi:hypothetical protein
MLHALRIELIELANVRRRVSRRALRHRGALGRILARQTFASRSASRCYCIANDCMLHAAPGVFLWCQRHAHYE